MNLRDVEVGILGALSAFDDKRRADQFEGMGERGKVGLDVTGQFRSRPGQRFIEHNEHVLRFPRLAVGQHVAKHAIGAIKYAAREKNAVPIADLNGALDGSHDVKWNFGRGFSSFI